MLIPFGILGASGGGAPADFEVISSSILSATASSVSFSSIPQTYKHLRVVIVGRTTSAVASENISFFWNDQGTSIANHRMSGNGSTLTSASNAGASAGNSFVMPGASATANVFGVAVADLLDYTSANKTKVLRTAYGTSAASGSWVGLSSMSSWSGNSATNLVQIYPVSAGSWAVGTRITLYGIKG